MRMIRLVLQRNEYIAGEVVSGTLVVKCDKKFRCERADIVLSGTFEQVQMVRKGVIESRYISPRSPTRPKVAGFRIYEDIVFSIGFAGFNAGNHKIPFQFQLPVDINPSTQMGNMGTGHSILCTMITEEKKNKKAKLRALQLIRILSPVERLPGESAAAVDGSQENILEIKVATQRLCITDRFSFLYKINSDIEFKELRAEIECTMKWRESTGTTQMQRVFSRREQKMSSEVVPIHVWREITLFGSLKNHNEQLPITVSSEILESSLALKVSMVGVKKRGTLTARIPIYVGHCLNPDWREEPDRNYRDDIKLMNRAISWTSPPPGTPRKKTIKISKPVEQRPDAERMTQNWYNKAVQLRKHGEIDRAIRSLETALKWSPDSEEALALLEELKYQEKDRA